MAIKYLDGIRLYRTLTAGIQQVISRQDYLNKINVFPVPDCDTGTNLTFTFATLEEGLRQKIHSNISRMATAIADMTLDNARGNSGAIMAQFMVGFSEGVNNHQQLNPAQFASAVTLAKQYAYDALASPEEGTILTVIADWTDVIRHLSEKISDFKKLMEAALERAKISLSQTPEKLYILAKAGVVDAGAQGFIDLLDGMQAFIESGDISKLGMSSIKTPVKTKEVTFLEKYRYCTECLVSGDDLDRITLKEAIMDFGNSIVIAGTKTKAKVHIHTDSPKTIMGICSKFGMVSDEKADDMLRQQKDAHGTHKAIAIVVDSGCDLPEDLIVKYNIHVVPVRLNFGDDHYVDKVTMTTEEFWDELKSNPHRPQTSQPTPGDFRRQYQFLSGHYENAISIHLPEKLSGTFQSALTATQIIPDFPVTVIDSLNGSIGMGLIAIRAAEAVEAGKSYDEVINIVSEAVKNTTVYIGLDTLDFAVKGGRVSPSKKRIADLFRINPILTFSGRGVATIGRTFGKHKRPYKFKNFISKQIPKSKPFRVGIGHANYKVAARIIEEEFVSLAGRDNVILTDIGPALGVHSGPGGLVIAVQILEDSLNG